MIPASLVITAFFIYAIYKITTLTLKVERYSSEITRLEKLNSAQQLEYQQRMLDLFDVIKQKQKDSIILG